MVEKGAAVDRAVGMKREKGEERRVSRCVSIGEQGATVIAPRHSSDGSHTHHTTPHHTTSHHTTVLCNSCAVLWPGPDRAGDWTGLTRRLWDAMLT